MRTDPVQSDSLRSEPAPLAPEPLAPEPLADVLQRIPRVPALTRVQTPSGLARWRAAWSRRQTLVTIALAPLIYAAYRGAVGLAGDGSPMWGLALVLLATMGAVVLATYVPPRGGPRLTTRSSPCAAGAGIHVILAGLVLNTVAAPASGVLALGLLAFAITQRMGVAACGVGAP